MRIPRMHEIRFMTGEIFLRAFKKYGFYTELLQLSRASARLQETVAEILIGDRSRGREAELIARIADIHIYLAAIEIALRAQNDVRTAIDMTVTAYTDQVLKK